MGKRVRFILPISPSVNQSYADTVKYTRQGRAYTKRIASEALTVFKQSAPLLMHQQGLYRDEWKGVQAVGYELQVYVPSHRSDLSNRLKAYEDAVTQYLGFDDSRVQEGRFTKTIDPDNPRIEGVWYEL